MAEGTLPMYYMVRLSKEVLYRQLECNPGLNDPPCNPVFWPLQGVKYNIPVAVWLPERYPAVPPIMYVNPTPDMVIKTRHSFVDASGEVSTPYLRNWAQPHSTLMIMCNDVSIQFGQDPPLFSKPPGWVPPAPPQHHQSPQRPHQQPSRAQSPAQQSAQTPQHHTFQAENPMNR